MNQSLGVGTVLHGADNDYTIVKSLGQGSFGITYLATAKLEGKLGSVNVKVAVKEFFMKEINSRSGSTVTGGSSGEGLFEKYHRKFSREAKNLSGMRHPGIVRVIESFDANGTSYIAMEYLDGGSLDDLIASRGRLGEEESLRFMRRIGEALSYMHSHNMLHLDLKPANIMLNERGEPVIIDFGLSKQYDEKGNPESSTTVGGGTPGYAPLEQSSYHEGKGFQVTMDVYALGATLFKMLTGHRPPEADSIFNDGFPYGDFQGVSQPVIDVVAKAMSLRKADRYQSVAEFLQALPGAAAAEATVIDRDDDVEVQSVRPAEPEPKLAGRQPEPKATGRQPGPVPRPDNRPAGFRRYMWLVFLLVGLAAGLCVVFAMRGCGGEVVTGEVVEEDEPAIGTATLPAGYVDLGLESGTLWKAQNESGGFYDYDEAMSKFGSRLPTKEQFEELMDNCDWTWNGSGYNVQGSNGNSIVLPASGYRCDGDVGDVGSYGGYWSSTPDNSDFARSLCFNSGEVYMSGRIRCCGVSVRLVQD